MKRLFSLFAVLLLLLSLAACGTDPADPTTEPTAEPTAEPTDPPATEPPTEPTEALVSEWFPQSSERLSYAKYLSESRAATEYCVGLFWIGNDGETEYTLEYTANGWSVFNQSDAWPALWTIPGSDSFDGINLMLCDGEWAYGTRNQTELIRVELATGATEMLFSADRMMCWPASESFAQNAVLVDRDWLFFLAKVDDFIGIYRLYLPDMRLDLLSDHIPGNTMPYALDLDVASYTQYYVSCVYLNPEIQDLVLNTLADTDSPYQGAFEFREDGRDEKESIDLTPAWSVDDPANALTVPIQLDFLVIQLQEDYDILGKCVIFCDLYSNTFSQMEGWAKPSFDFAPNDMPAFE